MLLKPSRTVVQENPLKHNHVEHAVNHDVYKKSNYHRPMIQSELQRDYFQLVSLICFELNSVNPNSTRGGAHICPTNFQMLIPLEPKVGLTSKFEFICCLPLFMA